LPRRKTDPAAGLEAEKSNCRRIGGKEKRKVLHSHEGKRTGEERDHLESGPDSGGNFIMIDQPRKEKGRGGLAIIEKKDASLRGAKGEEGGRDLLRKVPIDPDLFS